jgi:hypothetical protein
MNMPQQQGTARTAFAGILGSRKGLTFLMLVVLIGFACVALEVAIVVLTIRGRIDVDRAIGISFGTMVTGALGAVLAGSKLIDAISREDAATKAGPQSVAAGGDVIIPQGIPPAVDTSGRKGGSDAASG